MPDHAASMKKKTLKIQYSLYDSVGLFFLDKNKIWCEYCEGNWAKWKPHSHHLRHKQDGALSSDDEDFIVAKIM